MAGKRSKMPISERAKQFMPFAAVTGLNAALEAKERELSRVEKPQLTEEKLRELDEKLSEIRCGDEIKLTCFEEGEILLMQGILNKKDDRGIVIDGNRIEYEEILEIIYG